MIASNRLHSGLLRRWVQLQERMLWLEDEYGPDSAQAEKAVKALIDFEQDAGSALAAAVQATPLRRVSTRVREEDFINE